MTWWRGDDRSHNNAKLLAVDLDGTGLYFRAVSWCAQNETDGHIPTVVLTSLAPGWSKTRVEALAAKLVDAGLWAATDTGWQIPDYLTYNASRADLQARRQTEIDRRKTSRNTTNPPPKTAAAGQPGPEPATAPTAPPDVPPQPPPRDSSVTSRCDQRDGGVIDPGLNPLKPKSKANTLVASTATANVTDITQPTPFERFWDAYPRKVGKPAAKRAWRHVCPNPHQVAVHEILTGLTAWSGFWVADRTDERFIPHPASWLRDCRWRDRPPALGGPAVDAGRVVDEVFGRLGS